MQYWPGAQICRFAQALLPPPNPLAPPDSLAPPDPLAALDPPPLPCPPLVMQLSSSTVPSPHAQQPVYKTLPPQRSRHTLARKHSLFSQPEPPPALPPLFRPALPPLDAAPAFPEPPVLESPAVACPAWPAPPATLSSPPQAPNISGAPNRISASEPSET